MATEITMKDLLQATIDEGASDLHVRAFMPPELRVHGELVAIADESFTEEDTFNLCHEMMTPEQVAEVERVRPARRAGRGERAARGGRRA